LNQIKIFIGGRKMRNTVIFSGIFHVVAPKGCGKGFNSLTVRR
jgi:hypothetical protein